MASFRNTVFAWFQTFAVAYLGDAVTTPDQAKYGHAIVSNGSTKLCVDTNGGARDMAGDGCGEYANMPRYCGQMDIYPNFQAKLMCCACGGGSTKASLGSTSRGTNATTTNHAEPGPESTSLVTDVGTSDEKQSTSTTTASTSPGSNVVISDEDQSSTSRGSPFLGNVGISVEEQSSTSFASTSSEASQAQGVVVMVGAAAHGPVIEFNKSAFPRKSKTVLAIINVLGFGVFGVDRCFMGQVCCGCVKFFTLGGFVILAAIDTLVILFNCLFLESSIDIVGYQAQFQGPDDVNTAFWITLIFVFFECCSSCMYFCVLSRLLSRAMDYEAVGSHDTDDHGIGMGQFPPHATFQAQAAPPRNTPVASATSTSAPPASQPKATQPKAGSTTRASPEPLPASSYQAQSGPLPHVVPKASPPPVAKQQPVGTKNASAKAAPAASVPSSTTVPKANENVLPKSSGDGGAKKEVAKSIKEYSALVEASNVADIQSAIANLNANSRERLQVALAKFDTSSQVSSREHLKSIPDYCTLVAAASLPEIQSAISALNLETKERLKKALASTQADASRKTAKTVKDFSTLVSVSSLADIQSTIDELDEEARRKLQKAFAEVAEESRSLGDYTSLVSVTSTADIEAAMVGLTLDGRERLGKALAKADIEDQFSASKPSKAISDYSALVEEACVADIEAAVGGLALDARKRLEDAMAKASGVKTVTDYFALVEATSPADLQLVIGMLGPKERKRLEEAIKKADGAQA